MFLFLLAACAEKWLIHIYSVKRKIVSRSYLRCNEYVVSNILVYGLLIIKLLFPFTVIQYHTSRRAERLLVLHLRCIFPRHDSVCVTVSVAYQNLWHAWSIPFTFRPPFLKHEIYWYNMRVHYILKDLYRKKARKNKK